MNRLLVLSSLALFAAPLSAQAEDCTYDDLHGQFQITADCEGLQDFSGGAQEQKRIWLHGSWGELNVLEAPPPYKTAEPFLLMENLGRFWTKRRTPGRARDVQVGGQPGMVVSERKVRASSRTWIFKWQGRTLIARATAGGTKVKEREQRLELISAAFVASMDRPAASPAKAEDPRK